MDPGDAPCIITFVNEVHKHGRSSEQVRALLDRYNDDTDFQRRAGAFLLMMEAVEVGVLESDADKRQGAQALQN